MDSGTLSTTTMVAYADESEVETEQELKQKNVGSGESFNGNCGTNFVFSQFGTVACGFFP